MFLSILYLGLNLYNDEIHVRKKSKGGYSKILNSELYSFHNIFLNVGDAFWHVICMSYFLRNYTEKYII